MWSLVYDVMGQGVLRGGSWNNQGDNCRCANRNRNNPNNRNNNVGFRCASTQFCGNIPAKARVLFFVEKGSVHYIESSPAPVSVVLRLSNKL